MKTRTDQSGIVPGSQVRVLVKRTKAYQKQEGKFGKSHLAIWSPEIYTVLSRAGVNSFLVGTPAGEISIWPVHALQRVGTATVALPAERERVDIPVVRVKRMEARNISEAEQEVALAAPARSKRDRAPRVDYKALAKGN